MDTGGPLNLSLTSIKHKFPVQKYREQAESLALTICFFFLRGKEKIEWIGKTLVMLPEAVVVLECEHRRHDSTLLAR